MLLHQGDQVTLSEIPWRRGLPVHQSHILDSQPVPLVQLRNALLSWDGLPSHHPCEPRLHHLLPGQDELLLPTHQGGHGLVILAVGGDSTKEVPHDVVVQLPRLPVQLPPAHGPARCDRRMVSSIVTLPWLGQSSSKQLLADIPPVRVMLLLPHHVLQVKAVSILRGLRTGVGDVALDVQLLSNGHGVLRPHPQARAGHPHQLHRVQGQGPLLFLLLGGYGVDRGLRLSHIVFRKSFRPRSTLPHDSLFANWFPQKLSYALSQSEEGLGSAGLYWPASQKRRG